MPRYDDWHEKLIALSVIQEEAEFEDGTPKPVESDEVDCVCLECGHKFSDEEPDECPNCGGSDLDID